MELFFRTYWKPTAAVILGGFAFAALATFLLLNPLAIATIAGLSIFGALPFAALATFSPVAGAFIAAAGAFIATLIASAIFNSLNLILNLSAHIFQPKLKTILGAAIVLAGIAFTALTAFLLLNPLAIATIAGFSIFGALPFAALATFSPVAAAFIAGAGAFIATLTVSALVASLNFFSNLLDRQIQPHQKEIITVYDSDSDDDEVDSTATCMQQLSGSCKKPGATYDEIGLEEETTFFGRLFSCCKPNDSVKNDGHKKHTLVDGNDLDEEKAHRR